MSNATIDQSKKAKALFYSPMLDALKTNEKRSKDELSALLNIGEREVRDEISKVSMHYPVIAYSGAKGYRLAIDIKDADNSQLMSELGNVDLIISELNNRIKSLKKRLKPLIAYKMVATKKLNEVNNQ